MSGQKPIRDWRVVGPDSGPGLFVWFDPALERLTLRDLTEGEKFANLDKHRSVSGLIRSDQSERSDGCDSEAKPEILSQLSLPF